MQEQLISFETAKLAKEKGFDWRNIEILEVKSKSAFLDSTSQNLLQKWLREERDIHIKIDDFINDETGIEWDYEIVKIGTDLDSNGNYVPLISYSIDDPNRNFKTYELALEEALQETLKLIK